MGEYMFMNPSQVWRMCAVCFSLAHSLKIHMNIYAKAMNTNTSEA